MDSPGRGSAIRVFSIFFASLFLTAWCFGQTPAGQTPGQTPAAPTSGNALGSPEIDKKVDALLGQMTLEEKVGQLAQYSIGQATGPGTGLTSLNDMVAKGEVGGLFNLVSARDINTYQRIAVEKSRLHIPVIFGLDVIHGFRTEFPVPIALASTWDPDLVTKAARVAASEASATGIRWTFSPMVDISRDARWGRMTESGGEDPFLGAAMARAYVRGYQGNRLNAADSIAACLKHYVGYGAAEGGRDYNTTEISEHTLRSVYLPPFHAGVEAGAATVMSAFNSLNGVPASANHFTLTDILKKEWGFRGFVDSDWTSIAETVNHGTAIDGRAAARNSLLAGVDMDMVANLYHQHLADLVRSGQVPQSAIDEAARRVLRVKFALGLFEQPYADEKTEAAAMLKPESVEIALKAAEESFVLLKNDAVGGVPLLPLGGDEKIALIGPLADDAANMLGSWSAQGKAADVVTLRAALVSKIEAKRVLFAKGSEIVGGSDAQQSEAVAAAKQADIAVLALGEDGPSMTGEAGSRAHLGLPGRQQALLEAVVATGKPTVLILFSGRPLTLPWAFDHVLTVLAAWFPGVQAGPALVRTLFGDVNPTGRLVVSWPRAVGQEPLYYNALNTGRPAGSVDLTHAPKDAAEKYVSRYTDEQNSPQFPFGYGLSYTTIRYAATEVSANKLSAAELNASLSKKGPRTELTVGTSVTDTGTRAVEETVQVYIRLQGTSTSQPVRALKGFQRVTLAPGETKNVSFPLGPEAFALWNDHNQFVVEPSRLTVWVSHDSASGEPATIEIAP